MFLFKIQEKLELHGTDSFCHTDVFPLCTSRICTAAHSHRQWRARPRSSCHASKASPGQQLPLSALLAAAALRLERR